MLNKVLPMLKIDEIGDVQDRVELLVNHFSKGNKAAFGRKADIQSGVLAGILGGRKNKPSFELLQKLLTAYPSVEPNWLLFGRGPMLIGSSSSVSKYSGNVGQVPVLSTQDDIPVVIFNDKQLKYFFKRHEEFKPELAAYYEEDALQSISFPRSLLGSGFYYGFPVMNTMMEPLLEYGDIVIAKQINRENWFQITRKSIVIVTSKSHPYLIGTFGFNEKQSVINLSFNEKSWHSISLLANDVYEVWEFKWLLSSHSDKLSKDTSAIQLGKAFQYRLEEIDNRKISNKKTDNKEINNKKEEGSFDSYQDRIRYIVISNDLQKGMWPGDHVDIANDKEVIRLFEIANGEIEDHQKYRDDMIVIIDSIIEKINEESSSKNSK
jgi:hypothetical protein